MTGERHKIKFVTKYLNKKVLLSRAVYYSVSGSQMFCCDGAVAILGTGEWQGWASLIYMVANSSGSPPAFGRQGTVVNFLADDTYDFCCF